MADESKNVVLTTFLVLAIFIVLFLVLSFKVIEVLPGGLKDSFHSLMVASRILIINSLFSGAKFAMLGVVADEAVYLLITKGYITEPPVYVKFCSANDTATFNDCLVSMSVDCWEKYGKGRSDLLVGEMVYERDISLWDDVWGEGDHQVYDFSVPCGVITVTKEADSVTKQGIEEYYSGHEITTGNKTAGGRDLTYKKMIGENEFEDFVSFDESRTGYDFDDIGDTDLIVKIRYIDVPGDSGAGGIYGMCSFLGSLLSNTIEWLTDGLGEFPCWHITVKECGWEAGVDSPEASTQKDRVILCYDYPGASSRNRESTGGPCKLEHPLSYYEIDEAKVYNKGDGNGATCGYSHSDGYKFFTLKDDTMTCSYWYSPDICKTGTCHRNGYCRNSDDCPSTCENDDDCCIGETCSDESCVSTAASNWEVAVP